MFLFINKPKWYTSFDVIRKIKRLYRGEKVGHAGTLDPMATGLLIVAIGKDTKKLKHFVGLDKTYLATIDFSKKSDTWDLDFWKEFEELKLQAASWKPQAIWNNEKNTWIPAPSKQQIQEKFESILGYHPIPLTPFSAKKWKGKKLYEYAREGNPLFIDIDMQLIGFEIVDYTFPELKIKFHVGSGAYIRSYAHRIGEQFWLWWILTSLERVSVGHWKL